MDTRLKIIIYSAINKNTGFQVTTIKNVSYYTKMICEKWVLNITKVTSIGKYNTSFGLAFIVKNIKDIKVGQRIMIDNCEYKVKKVMLPPVPNADFIIAIFV